MIKIGSEYEEAIAMGQWEDGKPTNPQTMAKALWKSIMERVKENEMNGEVMELQTQSPQAISAEIAENLIVTGDLSKLSPQNRITYYSKVCESLGLNPLTRPFEYLYLNGKLVLYARRDATDQLRKLHHISITIVDRSIVGDMYTVTARATMPDGRTDESIGAVSLLDGKGNKLVGDSLANALMKAETKAKRRVTLSICGLGFVDESEIETIPDAYPVHEHAEHPIADEIREMIRQNIISADKVKELRKQIMPSIANATEDDWRKLYDTVIEHIERQGDEL